MVATALTGKQDFFGTQHSNLDSLVTRRLLKAQRGLFLVKEVGLEVFKRAVLVLGVLRLMHPGAALGHYLVLLQLCHFAYLVGFLFCK